MFILKTCRAIKGCQLWFHFSLENNRRHIHFNQFLHTLEFLLIFFCNYLNKSQSLKVNLIRIIPCFLYRLGLFRNYWDCVYSLFKYLPAMIFKSFPLTKKNPTHSRPLWRISFFLLDFLLIFRPTDFSRNIQFNSKCPSWTTLHNNWSI